MRLTSHNTDCVKLPGHAHCGRDGSTFPREGAGRGDSNRATNYGLVPPSTMAKPIFTLVYTMTNMEQFAEEVRQLMEEHGVTVESMEMHDGNGDLVSVDYWFEDADGNRVEMGEFFGVGDIDAYAAHTTRT
jgi:hypothetical protein